MNNKSTREIANNLAPGGFEFATASYGGWFISPELIYGVRIPMVDFLLTPRARVRYVAGFVDGYAEAGSAQNLTVNRRSLDDIEERLELEWSRVDGAAYGGTVKATATIGAIGLQRLGDTNVNTTLLAQNLAFVTPGRSSAFGGVVGTTVEYRPYPNVGLFAAAEGTAMNDKSKSGVAKGGLRVGF